MENQEQKERNNEIILGIIGGYQSNPGVSIVSDYFDREKRENLVEQGYEVHPVPEDTYSDVERIIRRSYKLMEQLENERTNKLASPLKEVREQGAIERGWPEPDYDHFIPEEKKVTIIEL